MAKKTSKRSAGAAKGSAGANGNPRRAETKGKRTAKPDRTISGLAGGKAVAQVTSKTRKANEAPWAMSRGNTDYARTAAKMIKGHQGATSRKMQAKRDAQNAPKE